VECKVSIDTVLAGLSDAVSKGDWQVAGGLLADGFFDYQPSEGEPSAGERIVPLLSDLRSAVPDLEVRVDDVVADGSLFRGGFSMNGTHQNPLWGAPGTGGTIGWTNPVTLKLTDGRLAFRFDDVAFPDLVALLRQFGLVNPPDKMDEPPPYPVSAPQFLLKVIMTGQAGHKECGHLDQIRVTEPGTRVCAPCYAGGVNWPALRMCLTCGAVGCCDTSKNKHAMKHYEDTGHPMMRSIRLDESWVWCYEDNAFFEGDILHRYPKQ
jgi:predicted ester cyclase